MEGVLKHNWFDLKFTPMLSEEAKKLYYTKMEALVVAGRHPSQGGGKEEAYPSASSAIGGTSHGGTCHGELPAEVAGGGGGGGGGGSSGGGAAAGEAHPPPALPIKTEDLPLSKRWGSLRDFAASGTPGVVTALQRRQPPGTVKDAFAFAHEMAQGLHKRIRNACSHRLSPEDLKRVLQAFQRNSTERPHGSTERRFKGLERAGMRTLLEQLGVSGEVAGNLTEHLFGELDKDGDGLVLWRDFVTFLPLLGAGPLDKSFPLETLRLFWDIWVLHDTPHPSQSGGGGHSASGGGGVAQWAARLPLPLPLPPPPPARSPVRP